MAAVAEQQTTDEVSLYDADTDDFYQDNTRIYIYNILQVQLKNLMKKIVHAFLYKRSHSKVVIICVILELNLRILGEMISKDTTPFNPSFPLLLDERTDQ